MKSRQRKTCHARSRSASGGKSSFPLRFPPRLASPAEVCLLHRNSFGCEGRATRAGPREFRSNFFYENPNFIIQSLGRAKRKRTLGFGGRNFCPPFLLLLFVGRPTLKLGEIHVKRKFHNPPATNGQMAHRRIDAVAQATWLRVSCLGSRHAVPRDWRRWLGSSE